MPTQLGSANMPDCLRPAGQGRTGEVVPCAQRRQRPQVAQARYAILQVLRLRLGPQQAVFGSTSGFSRVCDSTDKCVRLGVPANSHTQCGPAGSSQKPTSQTRATGS